MTIGILNSWKNLGITGRVDVDSLTVNGVNVTGASSNGTVIAASTPPLTATSAGVAGTITWDATHLYVCIATNTWVKASLATWA